jgi:hypothetical protein
MHVNTSSHVAVAAAAAAPCACIGNGIMPHPKPLNVVVGAPVEFDAAKVLKQHPEDANLDMFVDAYHEQYVAALKQLWATHKDKYAKDRRKSLDIVE